MMMNSAARLSTTTLAVLMFLALVQTPARAEDAKVRLELEASDPVIAPGAGIGIDAFAFVADGWHIHAHEPGDPFLIGTDLQLSLPEGVSVVEKFYPTPDKRSFEFAPGKQLLVYEGKVGIVVGVQVAKDFAGHEIEVDAKLRYQACNDTTCLPPATARASLTLRVDAAAGTDGVSFADEPAPAPPGRQEQIAAWLAERGLIFTLLAVALLGFGLNLTPCVYPLISVTIAYFGGQGGSRRRVAGLASLYVLGIALSFSVLGVAASLSGGVFGAALQRPAVILGIAALMVVLALGSFGVYQLQPPAFLMRWAGGAGSGAAGALFMGLTMGIVAAPCVGPIVLGLLLFIGSRQDPVLGFSLFFVLALGMGAPYLLLALAAGSIRKLPRSGEWLQWVEYLFGCLLLALAAYFLSPLLPSPLKQMALPAVIGASGLYLGFMARAGHALRGFVAFKRVAGAAMLLFAVFLARPAQGGRIAWEPIDVLAAAPAAGKPLLIDFVAEWCIPCREMEHSTYVDAAVIDEAERFRMVKADLTEESDATSQVVEKFAVRGVPTVLLLSGVGEETHRMVGYVGPDELLRAMREVH